MKLGVKGPGGQTGYQVHSFFPFSIPTHLKLSVIELWARTVFNESSAGDRFVGCRAELGGAS